MKKIKKFFCLFLSVVILTTSISAYKVQKVQGAEYVAGVVSAIGAGSILSALLIGGTVVAGGIAVYELATSTPSDRQMFVDGLKTGFQDFITEIETNELLQNNANITQAQAIEQATATASATVKDFTDNALDQAITTGKNLKTKTVEYWKRFCNEVNDISDNGITSGGSGSGSGTIVNNGVPLCNNSSGFISETSPPLSLDSDTFVTIQGKKYIQKGQYQYYLNDYVTVNFDYSSRNNGLIKTIPIAYINFSGWTAYFGVYDLYINSETGERTGGSGNGYGSISGQLDAQKVVANHCVANTNISINLTYSGYPDIVWLDGNQIYDAGLLEVGNYNGNMTTPAWKYQVDGVLKNTKIGKSIQTGRRQRVVAGDYVGNIFVEDSYPIKKSSLRINEGVATGAVGWDIPSAGTWDDYLAGGINFPRVTGDTGTIVVPKTGVTDYPTDRDIEFPDDTDVYDSGEGTTDGAFENPTYPYEPTKPDVIQQEQGGEFYPTAMDLTTVFPFCIPFDIAYCIGKFQTPVGTAPVVHIPIPIPNRLQSSIGQSYDVVIDFNDYIVLRNIIRYFILLFFIVALMGFTRNIIRG